MNYIRNLLLSALISTSLLARKIPILKSEKLAIFDGVTGLFDGHKVNRTLWLMKQIQSIHDGIIQINDSGAPDPTKGKQVPIVFKGKKRTIKELIELEQTIDTMSKKDKQDFVELFQLVKAYFGMVHDILLADARGAQQIIIDLIKEYCRVDNRSTSLLLKWDEKGSEAEMYEADVINFKVFYVLTTDLKNFLSSLIKSCPKGFADYRKKFKKA